MSQSDPAPSYQRRKTAKPQIEGYDDNTRSQRDGSYVAGSPIKEHDTFSKKPEALTPAAMKDEDCRRALESRGDPSSEKSTTSPHTFKPWRHPIPQRIYLCLLLFG